MNYFNNKRPKVSVVMSVFNGERYLREAIESILNQTFTDFEFIIIDDASTDNTGLVIKKYASRDSRIIEVKNEENLGLTRSLNKGIKLAKGEYIARMDADDISFPERMEKQAQYLEQHSNVGALGSRYLRIDAHGCEVEVNVPMGKERIFQHMLLFGSPFCHSAIMFKKSALELVGYYDETQRYAQDYDLATRLFEVCEIENYPEILLKWRANEKTGISIRKKRDQREFSNRIRKKFNETQLQKGLIDYHYLRKLICQYPLDSVIADFFFDLYKKSGIRKDSDFVIFLKLKYFHNDQNSCYLNEFSRFCLSSNKKFLSFMSLTESLRLNPFQKEELALLESLRQFSNLPVPKFLEPDQCEISVIMAAYDRKEEIRASIQSVLDQTFEDFELIIINDGGLKEIEDVVRSFNSSKIRYFRLEKNVGHAGALNHGVLCARGRFIAYLDDDDIYYSKHLEILYKAIQKNKKIDVVYANAWWSSGKIKDDLFIEDSRKLNPRPDRYDRGFLFTKNYISNLNVMHRRSCFLKVGLFNQDLVHLHDWDLLVRLAEQFKFLQINEITGEYRWKNNNYSVVNTLDMLFLEKILRFYYGYQKGAFSLLKSYVAHGEKIKAAKIIREIGETYISDESLESFQKEFLRFYRDFGMQGRWIFIKIMRDLLFRSLKKCLKAAIEIKSFLLFSVVIFFLPIKLFKMVIHYFKPLKTAKVIA